MTSEGGTSWLCPTEGDRERVLDMEQRLAPLRAAALSALALALLISGPWVGWWTLIPLGIAGGLFAVIGRGIDAARRPEYRMFAVWVLAEIAIAASVALTGGPSSPGVAWLALPVVTLAARFSMRGVAVGVAAAVVLLFAATLGVHPHYAIHHPQSVLFPLALLVALGLLSLALMQSDRQHRSASVIDPLTSLLNRNALHTRVEELVHQARVISQPIAVVVGDIDHFKEINDSHGHAVGDVVLQDLAYRFRKRLRAFDLTYRIGGEEFAILLPGASAEQAGAVAEDLRAAIADEPVAGIEITMSFGVSASTPGSFDYDATFRAADRALYEAKRLGRDRVELDRPAHADRRAPALA